MILNKGEIIEIDGQYLKILDIDYDENNYSPWDDNPVPYLFVENINGDTFWIKFEEEKHINKKAVSKIANIDDSKFLAKWEQLMWILMDPWASMVEYETVIVETLDESFTEQKNMLDVELDYWTQIFGNVVNNIFPGSVGIEAEKKHLILSNVKRDMNKFYRGEIRLILSRRNLSKDQIKKIQSLFFKKQAFLQPDLPTSWENVKSLQHSIPSSDRDFARPKEPFQMSTAPLDLNKADDLKSIQKLFQQESNPQIEQVQKFLKTFPLGTPYAGPVDGKINPELLSALSFLETSLGPAFKGKLRQGNNIIFGGIQEAQEEIKNLKKKAPEAKNLEEENIKSFQKFFGFEPTGLIDQKLISAVQAVENKIAESINDNNVKGMVWSPSEKKFKTSVSDMSNALSLIKNKKIASTESKQFQSLNEAEKYANQSIEVEYDHWLSIFGNIIELDKDQLQIKFDYYIGNGLDILGKYNIKYLSDIDILNDFIVEVHRKDLTYEDIEEIRALTKEYSQKGVPVKNIGYKYYYSENCYYIIDEIGNKEWFKDNKPHRLDGPAKEYADGSKLYYVNGKLHKENGPAAILANGGKEYWKNGKKHNLNGPAVFYPNGLQMDRRPYLPEGYKEYWIDGIKYTEEDFNYITRKK